MKVTEHLATAEEIPISFEIIPPLRGRKINELMMVVEELLQYNPPFIDVTSHASQWIPSIGEGGNGKSKKKRPGTLPICMLIQERYKVDAVCHVLCHGFSREETEDFLIDLNYAGISNVFAIRGDDINYNKQIAIGKTTNTYAKELVEQIHNMNQGIFLDDLIAEPTDFHVGVAGYPEKHFEAEDEKTDLKHLKEKVDAGAQYIVTQMFFNNNHYFSFVNKCRDIGINVPIIPGLKVICNKGQLEPIRNRFHIDVSEEVVGAIWTAKQVEELLKKEVPAIHFYVTQNAEPVHEVMRYISG